MAPLTWREVSAPNFSGANEANRLAAELLSNGFGSAINAVSKFGDRQNEAANGDFLARVASYGNDAAGLDAALKSGQIFNGINKSAVNPDAFKFAVGREGDVLANQGTALANDTTREANDFLGWNNDRVKAQEAARPAAVDLAARIQAAEALGTPEGHAEASRLRTEGSGILAAAGMDVTGIAAFGDKNTATSMDGVAANNTFQKTADDNKTRADGIAADAEIARVRASAASAEDGARMLANNPKLTPEQASLAVTKWQQMAPSLFSNADINTAVIDQALKEGSQGGNASGLDPMRALVAQTEGGGNADTLFGNAQRDGGAFSGVKVSEQTIGALKQFSSPEGAYGKYQKSIGSEGTPMGEFQIVGRTLADAAKEMGLSDDTVFTRDVQAQIFQHLVDRRLDGPRTMEGKMAGLRQEWAGFKNVSDADLTRAIQAYEGGDRSALSANGASSAPAASGGGNQTAQSILDAAVAQASKSTDFKGLNSTQNQALLTDANQQATHVQDVLNTVNTDSIFGRESLLADLTGQSEYDGKSEIEIVQDLQAKLNAKQNAEGIAGTFNNENDIVDVMNRMQEKYGMEPRVAAAFLKNAVEQPWWIARWFQGQTKINDNEIERLVGTFYNKDGKTAQEKLKPALQQIEAVQQKSKVKANLQALTSQADQLKQAYFNAQQRAAAGFDVDVQGALLRYNEVNKALKAAIDAATKDDLLTANVSAKGK